MANRLAAIRIGFALAIFAACPIGLAAAATIDVPAASAKDFVASLGGTAPRQGEEHTGDENASLANAVDSVKPQSSPCVRSAPSREVEVSQRLRPRPTNSTAGLPRVVAPRRSDLASSSRRTVMR